MKKIHLACAISASLLLAACGSDDDKNLTSLKFSLVGSHVSGNDFATSSAEIVSYDTSVDLLYVVNAQNKSVDVLGFDEQNSLVKQGAIDLTPAQQKAGFTIGAANSVVAKKGYVAIAIENSNKQQNGIVALYKSEDLSFINSFPAGALPDMVTMTEDGLKIIVANEGEPSGDYQTDPEGSVTVIDISNGTADGKAIITQLNFNEFDAGQSRHSELNNVRLPAPFDASVSQDLEPEYITITSNNQAVVALQENNAFAVINLNTNHIDRIQGLGEKSWASIADGGQGYQLDLTNKDELFTLNSYPQLTGYYMPDSIASFSLNGEDFIISANEGDGREYIYKTTQSVCDQASHQWEGDDYTLTEAYTLELDDCISYSDEGRGKDLNVSDAHPLMNASIYGDNIISNKNAIGRIKVVMDQDTVAANENVHTFGARSFSIWNAQGELVFDSGSQLSEIANSTSHFNLSNDNQINDDRSDDKGVEPEAIEVAVINNATVAFIGLERQGGIAAYDISNPQQPIFLDYINNRDFSADVCTSVDIDGECENGIYNPQVGDLGPESIEYIFRDNQHFIAVGNEVSGTTSLFKLNIEIE